MSLMGSHGRLVRLSLLFIGLTTAVVAAAVGIQLRHGQSMATPSMPTTLPVPAGNAPSQSLSVRSVRQSPFGNASFSPDGTAWLSPGRSGLAVGAVANPAGKVIKGDVIAAAWGPDSQTLAVTTSSTPLTSEDQTLPVSVMKSDGSNQRQIGQTDVPRYIQYLMNGEVAFIYQGQVHLVQADSGADNVVAKSSPDLSNDVPFQFTADGNDVALLEGRTLSVVNRASGKEVTVSETIDAKRWQPYSWSPDGKYLVFADETEDLMPTLHVYDRNSGDVSALLYGQEPGAFAGMSWTPKSGWLVFAFYPTGTGIESGAVYQGLNVYTGATTELFRGGLGLRLSPNGHQLIFTRTEGDQSEVGAWIAEISF
jgi:hypothetical protein